MSQTAGSGLSCREPDAARLCAICPEAHRAGDRGVVEISQAVVHQISKAGMTQTYGAGSCGLVNLPI